MVNYGHQKWTNNYMVNWRYKLFHPRWDSSPLVISPPFTKFHQVGFNIVALLCIWLQVLQGWKIKKEVCICCMVRFLTILHASIVLLLQKMNLLKNNTNPKYVLTQQAQNHWVSSKFILFSLCKSFICNYPIHLYLNCNKCKCSKQYLFQLHMFFKHTKEELRKSRKGKNRNQKNCIKFNLQLIGRSWSPWHWYK